MSIVSTELSRGVLPAADLRERLGVSPATLMRVVRNAGLDVVRIGRQVGLEAVAVQGGPGGPAAEAVPPPTRLCP